jgi:hypothetical protein
LHEPSVAWKSFRTEWRVSALSLAHFSVIYSMLCSIPLGVRCFGNGAVALSEARFSFLGANHLTDLGKGLIFHCHSEVAIDFEGVSTGA